MNILKLLFTKPFSSKNNEVLHVSGKFALSTNKEVNKSTLEHATVPSNIEIISNSCFANCKNLKKVNFSKNLQKIGDKAFYKCESLSTVKLPKTLKYIGDEAFKGCAMLEKISLPDSIKHMGEGCFDECWNISSIKLPKFADNLTTSLPEYLDYLVKSGNDFYYQKEEKKGALYVSSNYFIKYCVKHWDDKNLRQRMNYLNNIYYEVVKFFYKKAKGDKGLTFVNNILTSNIKKYNWLRRRVMVHLGVMDDLPSICKILGVFETKPLTIKRISKSGKLVTNVIDYSQKATEFLYQAILNGKLDTVDLFEIARYLQGVEFNPKFADFVFDNFDEIMKNGTRFFVKCYQHFDEVQKTHTKNKGDCKQLAPTVEYFLEYFNTNKFTGVNEKNRNIANVVGKYYREQSTFDEAQKVMKKFEENKVPNNILGEDLKEDCFASINKKLNKIAKLSEQTLNTLCEAGDEKFSYEFLKKNDVVNLVLGKICNCCAHLSGVGDGIAIGSVLNPNVQNVVIRNKNGEIVAKSTIYVNRKQGYAVCNTFKASTKLSVTELCGVYDKFKQAIKDFATRYNQKFEPKLKVVNIGMDFNDLRIQIKKNDKKANTLLPSFDFSVYSNKIGHKYKGDADFEQYTVWQDNTK